MESKLDQTQLERPYTFFLFKRIDQIYEAWDEADLELALRRALRLVVFLPNDIKDALWPKKEEITKKMRDTSQIQSVDFFTSHLVRNKASFRVAMFYLEPFVDEMVRRLDEKKWLERGALKPRFDKKRKLSV